MRRRDFIRTVACGTGATMMASCGGPTSDGPTGPRVLVVAFDGLDPRIVESLMQAGKLPNFSRLKQRGDFRQISTSTPPHTPVAFSNIISGADPGLHQIFDFIHRKPNPEGSDSPPLLYSSTSEAVPPETDWAVSLGDWRLPLAGGSTENRRQGPAFWDYLVAEGIDTQIYYLPSNYPSQTPEGSGHFRAISGMGTPDLLGGYGTFTFYGPRPASARGGGRFVPLYTGGKHRHKVKLEGPANFLRKSEGMKRTPMLSTTIEIVRDPTSRVAKFKISGSVVLLAEGEWSDWITVVFPTGIPGSALLSATGAPTSLRGMVRLYLKRVHPEIELYVSPLNIDPANPVNPISSPPDFSRQMAERHGRFCTIGIPEDTKSLTHGALDKREFLEQCDLVAIERAAQYRQALADFKSGCLFFYFGATDLIQHMFWRDRDEQHPGRIPEEVEQFSGVITDIYLDADRLVADAMNALGPDDTLIVCSDHGFNSFRRGFHLNSWLLKKEYIQLADSGWRRKFESFYNIDWPGTKVYGVGMNALYVNTQGREKHGLIKPELARSMMEEVRDKLMEERDEDGTAVFDRIDLVQDIYPGADPSIAPDLILGYNDGYRASWASILGDMPILDNLRPGEAQSLQPWNDLENNLKPWSGTHLITPDKVSGMLLTSRPVAKDNPSISDLAPTILDLFDIATPPQMIGQSLFSRDDAST